MKILLLFVFIMIVPISVMAQRTLGSTEEEFRSTKKPASGWTMLKGRTSDTLIIEGGIQIVVYYKNDTCYASRSTYPIIFKSNFIKKMTDDAFQKIDDKTWVNAVENIKVIMTDSADKQQVMLLDTWLHGDKK